MLTIPPMPTGPVQAHLGGLRTVSPPCPCLPTIHHRERCFQSTCELRPSNASPCRPISEKEHWTPSSPPSAPQALQDQPGPFPPFDLGPCVAALTLSIPATHSLCLLHKHAELVWIPGPLHMLSSPLACLSLRPSRDRLLLFLLHQLVLL